MGFALAAEAARARRRRHRRGRQRGPASATPAVRYVDVATAAELAAACAAEFERADVLLMAAAVADYRPAAAHAGKIKKTEAGAELALALERTEDVLAGLAARRRSGQVIVGFAAEAGEGAVAYGRDKLARKQLDAVVVNDIAVAGIGFDAGENEVTIVTERYGTPCSAYHEGGGRVRDPRHRLEPAFIHHPESLTEPMEPTEPLPESVDQAEVDATVGFARRIEDNIRRAVKVKDDVLRHVVVTLLAEGHILVEDYPGVGKTALARALSRTLDCQFARVQCTADLLPADIVGANVFNQRETRFEFRPGPDLRQRRARRRDQPRVAEDAVGPARVHAGAPRHRRRALARARDAVHGLRDPEPGRVRGHLPAARGPGRPLHGPALARLPEPGGRGRRCSPATRAATACSSSSRSSTARRCWPPRTRPRRVHASRALRDYIVALLRHTRDDNRVELGASPRAGLMLLRAAKAHALVNGRDHALPDDVQTLAPVVLSHRIMLVPEAAGVAREQIVADAVAGTPAL